MQMGEKRKKANDLLKNNILNQTGGRFEVLWFFRGFLRSLGFLEVISNDILKTKARRQGKFSVH